MGRDAQKLYRSEKGEQMVCLSAIMAAILGFILDAITYYAKYSPQQSWVQGISMALCLSALIVFLINRTKNYVFAFGLISYVVIGNIFVTATIIDSFNSFETFTEANGLGLSGPNPHAFTNG